MHTSHCSFWILAGGLMLAVECAQAQTTPFQPGQKIWEFQTGGPVTAAAVAIDGTVYFGSADKKVYALDGRTGSKKWEFQADAAIVWFPVVGPDGTVYVVAGGTTYALDGATGARKPRLGTSFYSALAYGHTVYSVTPGLAALGMTGKLSAIDSVTGEVKWESTLGLGGVGPWLNPSPLAMGSDVTIYFGDGSPRQPGFFAPPSRYWLSALDGLTGRQRWTFEIPAQVSASPVVGPDGTVYVGYSVTSGGKGKLYAVNGSRGTLKWQRGDINVSASPALAADGALFVPDSPPPFGAKEGAVLALDSTTGELKWKFEAGNHVSNINLGSDGTVYFGSEDGKAYALKGTTGLAPGPWPKFQQNAQNTGLLQISTPPRFLTQATNQSAVVGTSVKLEALAAGAVPLRYQWRKDEQPILGATNHVLLLPSVKVADTGKYSVQVNNSLGSVTSTGAVLTVGYSLATNTRQGKGLVRKNPDLAAYPPRTRVELLAVPEGDRGFVRWEGSLSETANPLTVTMETNLVINAVFDLRPGDELWKFQIIPPFTFESYAFCPAVGADGTVYATIGSMVYALNARSGDKKWEFKAPGGFAGGPVIGSDRTVYVATYESPYSQAGGRGLYALSGETGAQKWSFLSEGPVTAPVIGIDGAVYFGLPARKVYSLDGATGKKNWEFNTPDAVFLAPAVGADGTVFVASGKKVYALEGATGNRKWEFVSELNVRTSFAIGGDGTIYFGGITTGFDPVTQGKFYGVNGGTGKMKWVLTGDIFAFSSAVVGMDDTVFVAYALNYRADQINNGAVDALEGATGKKKWSFQGGFSFSQPSTPVLGADGTVYFGSAGGKLYVLDAMTGSKKWEAQIDLPRQLPYPAGDDIILSPLALGADNIVYVVAQHTIVIPPGPPVPAGLPAPIGNVLAVQASSGLAHSPWPKFQQNARNTGSIQEYFKSVARFDPALARFTRDGFSFSLESEVGQAHQIEWTSDWRVWTPLQLFTNTLRGALILDRGALSSSYRFYRARTRTGN